MSLTSELSDTLLQGLGLNLYCLAWLGAAAELMKAWHGSPQSLQCCTYTYDDLHDCKLHFLRCVGSGAESATWRRGAKGRPHVGQPLCNRCGVWDSRHPDSPPRSLIEQVSIPATCCTSCCCCCCCGEVGHNLLEYAFLISLVTKTSRLRISGLTEFLVIEV